MFTLVSLTTLYLLALVGVGAVWPRSQQEWPWATQGLPATGNVNLATPWLKSVNWNGGDDKKPGGK